MPWITLLTALLPILLQILQSLLGAKDVKTLRPGALRRLEVLHRDCDKVVGQCKRLGIAKAPDNVELHALPHEVD